MTNKPEPESAGARVTEQVCNPVATGLELAQLAEFTQNVTERMDGRGTVPVLLLRALCRLTQRHPDAAVSGFSPLELQQEVERERPRWARSDDKTQIARQVRIAWNKLEPLFERKRELFSQTAEQCGLSVVPKLDRQEGGGSGYMTKYRLVPAAPEQLPVVPDQEGGGSERIEYYCEDIEGAGRLVRAFVGGFEPRGWRRWLYLSGWFVLLIGIYIIVMMAMLSLYSERMIGRVVVVLACTGLTALFIWRGLVPLYRPLFVRIAAAPSWMQSDDSDRLLELRCRPRYERKALYAVRYRGTCPLCGGTVRVKQRGWFDSVELVGYCEEAPMAHRFSFDHVLRIGERLKP